MRAVVPLLLLAPALTLAAPPARDEVARGLWQMEFSGVSGSIDVQRFEMPVCNPHGRAAEVFAVPAEAVPGCTVSRAALDHGRLHYVLACDGEDGGVRIEITGRYTRTRLTTRISAIGADGDTPVTTVGTWTGRHVGACPAAPAQR